MTLCDFKLQFHDPLSFQDAHAQTSYEAQLAKVDQSQIFLCFCLGDLGHWFWSWFSCGPHTGGKVTFLRSLLLDKDPHRWLAASTRSLPPAEKTLDVDTVSPQDLKRDKTGSICHVTHCRFWDWLQEALHGDKPRIRDTAFYIGEDFLLHHSTVRSKLSTFT